MIFASQNYFRSCCVESMSEWLLALIIDIGSFLRLSSVRGISNMRHRLLHFVVLFVVSKQSPCGDGLAHKANTVPATLEQG